MVNAIEAARIRKNNGEEPNRRDFPPPNQPPLDNPNTPSNYSFPSSQDSSLVNKLFGEGK
jgi:hypothetical protein